MKALGKAWVIAAAFAVTGCSLLYNPANLPSAEPDAGEPPPPDAPIANPDGLALMTAGPLRLHEGQGTGGSRPAVLVLTGINIAADAQVSLVASDGTAPLIEVDQANAVRAYGTLAVPVTLPIDVARAGAADGTADVALTVQVTQQGSAGPVTVALADQVRLVNYPELDAPVVDGTKLAPRYSRIEVTQPWSFTPTAGAAAIKLDAVSSIALAELHVDAAGQYPGPGGATGGAALFAGGGVGGGLPGALIDLAHLALLASASGGGFGEAGGNGSALLGPVLGGAATGEEMLRVFFNNHSAGGGGGGTNPGGGGGGALTITAGGDLTATAITANGAKGGADGSLLSGAGGGGSGGTILLRALGTTTLTSVRVDGGAAGANPNTASAPAGAGGAGRLRYDLSKLAGTPTLPKMRRAGASFSANANANPAITRNRTQDITLDTVPSTTLDNNVFDVYVLNQNDATTHMTQISFKTPQLVVPVTLAPGYNRVCVTFKGGDPLNDKLNTNCLEVGYVP